MPTNTLVRHAELFGAALCGNIRDMVGVELQPVTATLEEVRFAPSMEMTVMIHFTGAIQGEFAISLDEVAAARMIGCWGEGMSAEELRENRGDYGGFLKEVLNVSVGQVIPDLEKEFDALTFLSPVVIWGAIEYPDVPSGRMRIEGEAGGVECFFVLNMMGLELGERLHAAIQALGDSVREAGVAKRSVQSMLDAFPMGLVTVDRGGKVRPGHAARTASTVGLPENTALAGMHIVELLGFEDASRRDFELWLEIVHERHGAMPFRDLVGLCPVRERGNSRGNLLLLEWVPLPGDAGSLEGLLLMIEDVKEKRRIEHEMKKLSRQHEENVELLTQLVNLEPDEVQDFVYDSSGLLDQARQIVQGAGRDRRFIEGLYRTVHTLKGNSGQYQFRGLQKMAMDIENDIARLRDEFLADGADSAAGEQVGSIAKGLEEAEAYLHRLEDLRAKLGSRNETVQDKAARSVPTVMVPVEEIDAIASNLWGMREAGRIQGWSPVVVNTLGQSAASACRLREIDIMRLAPSMQNVVEKTGKRVGKKVRLSVAGGAFVDVDVARELHRCFVHLLNNAIDHGIETADVRSAAGKLDTGVVTLDARREGAFIVVVLADDGCGIDVGRVRANVVEKGLATPEQVAGMRDDQILSYIFQSGFSTRAEVSELSGRGVGLDFVMAAVQSLGGAVAIDSEPGKGTRFTLRLPLDVAQPSHRFNSVMEVLA